MAPGQTRVLMPGPGVRAFYDGRIDGHRFEPGPNWVDEGAISLGIASYAILGGDEALVYDIHDSVEHGRYIRAVLEAVGVNRITVLLSHWHLDGPGLLRATQDYIRFLLRCAAEPELRETPLREILAAAIDAGDVKYFEPYEDVHRKNLVTVLAG